MRKLFFAVIPSIFGVLVVLIVLTSGCVGTVCDSASMRAAMLGQMVKVEIPYIKPGPPPPGHLRVLVTYFVDDADGTVTKHLYNSISLEPLFDTVLLYAPLDVPTEGTREDKEAATWNAASRLAKLWDADVVVYGDRDISGDRVVLGVQATSSTAPADTSLYFLDKNSMTLPYDLAGKLGAAVVTAVLGRADTRFSANELNVDHLISAADEMGEVLSVSGNLLQGEAKARLWGQLGETAELIGTRQNNIYALKVAEAADIVALQIFWRAQDWPLWARAQSNLSMALLARAVWEGDAALYDRATAATRAALTVHTRESDPMDWAVDQANLGGALNGLAETKGNDLDLERQAIDAFRQAELVQTRRDDPLNWAIEQSNVALVLFDRGLSKDDTAQFVESIKTFKTALTVLNRKNDPHNWAWAENGLGLSLVALGTHTISAPLLNEAVHAYKEVLKVRTRDYDADDWAVTQRNLSIALNEIDKLQRDSTNKQAADVAARAAHSVFNESPTPKDQPVCRLIALPEKLDQPGNIMLIWDSWNATSGRIENLPLYSTSGFVTGQPIAATTTYKATFANPNSGKSVQCSDTVTVGNSPTAGGQYVSANIVLPLVTWTVTGQDFAAAKQSAKGEADKSQ